MSEQPSMMQMMKQARALQKKMGKAQKKVEKRDVQADVGGGKVQVVCSGKLEVKRILIEQELIDGGDKRAIQDLVCSGVNAALKKAQDMVSKEMAKVASDMGLPEDALGEGADHGDDSSDDTPGSGGGRLSRLFGRS